MPHVILSGTTDLKLLHQKFSPFRGDSNDWIIKVQRCLVTSDYRTLVFDTTAVRSGFAQDFYLRADIKDDKISIRVDPYVRIERNEGVQRAIAAVTSWICHNVSETLTVSKTNLPDPVLKDMELQ